MINLLGELALVYACAEDSAVIGLDTVRRVVVDRGASGLVGFVHQEFAEDGSLGRGFARDTARRRICTRGSPCRTHRAGGRHRDGASHAFSPDGSAVPAPGSGTGLYPEAGVTHRVPVGHGQWCFR